MSRRARGFPCEYATTHHARPNASHGTPGRGYTMRMSSASDTRPGRNSRIRASPARIAVGFFGPGPDPAEASYGW